MPSGIVYLQILLAAIAAKPVVSCCAAIQTGRIISQSFVHSRRIRV